MSKLKIIPVSYMSSQLFKDLQPGKYAVVNFKKSKIIQIIEVFPKPKDLEIEYEMIVKEKKRK